MTDTDTKQIVAINRCQIRKVYCVKINRLTKTMDVNDKDYEGKSQPIKHFVLQLIVIHSLL